MADFLTLASRHDQHLGQYAKQLFRIESHLRRGERRAAQARLNGLIMDLETVEKSYNFALETTFIGAQIGFLSGDGPILSGRLPGALIGAATGWLFGHASIARHQAFIQEIKERTQRIAEELHAAQPQSH